MLDATSSSSGSGDTSEVTRPPEAATVRSVSWDALLYVPGRIIPAVIQILMVTVLTHFFSTAEIGRYDLTFRFVLFLSTFTFLWLNMSILRFYAACDLRGQLKAFFGVMGGLKYGAIAGGLLIGGAVYFFGPDTLFGTYRDLLGAGLSMFVAYTLYETGLAVLRAKRKPLTYSVATTINAGLRLPVAVALFAWFKMDIGGMLWATAGSYLLAHLLVVQKHVGSPRLMTSRGERELLKEILAYGVPIWLTQILNFLIMNSDRYLLKLFHSDAQVGLYAVTTNLIDQPMALVFQTFGLAVFPSVAAVWESQGREAAENLVGGVTRIFFLLCVPLMVFLMVLAHPIFTVLARGEAREAYQAASWVAIAAFLYGLSYFANFGLHLSKRTHVLLAATVVALLINLGSNCVFIPWKGFVGAGMSRVVSNVFLVVLVAAAGHRYLHWRLPVRRLLRIVFAAGISGLGLWWAQGRLPENIFTLAGLFVSGGVAYGVLLLLLRELPMTDIRAILAKLGLKAS